MPKPPLILFHNGCHDGYTAAWCVARRLPRGAELVGVRYGDPVPDLRGRAVYIVDFSWPPEQLLPAIEGAGPVVMLDHHQTAWRDWEHLIEAEAPRMQATLGNLELLIDLERSGARLAWEWADAPPAAEALVDYVEDRDLWRWALPDSEAISTRLTLHPQTLDAWDAAAAALADADLAESAWVREGKLLLKQTRRRVKRQARMAVRVPSLPGAYEKPVLLANAPVLTSETCHKLLESGGAQVAIAWWIAHDAVSMSLRSTEKADVSVLSRRLGEIHPGFVSGGGHPQAAGARFGRAEGLALVSGWLDRATDWKF